MKDIKIFLLLPVCAGFIHMVNAQADYNKSYGIEQMTIKDKALWIADFLVTHPDVFKQLERVGVAAFPLLGESIDDSRVSTLLTAFLNWLPSVLSSPFFGNTLRIYFDETQRTNLSDAMSHVNDTNRTSFVAHAILTRTDYVRLAHRILSQESVRELFPLDQNVNHRCYDEIVTFVDSLGGGEPSDDTVSTGGETVTLSDFAVYPWAYKMLFASGLVSSGFQKEAVTRVGLYDECHDVMANVDSGVVLGNVTLTRPVHFETHLCEVSFRVPSLVQVFLGLGSSQTSDIVDWGFCLPQSCSNDDVRKISMLGPFKHLQLDIAGVTCH